jgi:hypothetical protein
MHINIQLPSYRLPRVIKGDLRYEPLADPHGRPLILTCLHSLTEPDSWILESQTKELSRIGWALTLLLPYSFPSTESWARPIQEFGIPMFTDPLNRASRALHLFHNLRQGRCETLFFDPQRYLQFRLIHDLNLRGFSTLLDIAKSDLVSSIPPNRLTPGSSRKVRPTHSTGTSGSYERSPEISEILA